MSIVNFLSGAVDIEESSGGSIDVGCENCEVFADSNVVGCDDVAID